MKQFVYTVRLVELPTNKAKDHVENWRLLAENSRVIDSSDHRPERSFAVVPASFTKSVETFGMRFSDRIGDDQLRELIQVGTILSARRLVGHSGQPVDVSFGRELSFVTSFETVKDRNGKETQSMRPVVTNFHQGIRLNLAGTMDGDKEHVRLSFNFEQSELESMDTFTFESVDGPLTVQQPGLSVQAIQTSQVVPLNETVAIFSGPVAGKKVVKPQLSLFRKLHSLGGFFKSMSSTTDSRSKIVLIKVEKGTSVF